MIEGKRLLVLCTILILAASAAWGAAAERPRGTALQFGLNGLLDPSTFHGATVGLQGNLSDNLALRGGLTLRLDFDSYEQTEEGTEYYEGWGSGEFEEWSNSVGLNLELIAFRGETLSLYYGGGPCLSYSDSQDVYVDFWFGGGYEDETRISRRRIRELGLGLSGVLGVQWAPLDWLALHLEYRSTATYAAGERVEYEEEDSWDHSYTYENTQTFDGYRFHYDYAVFGMSVYF